MPIRLLILLVVLAEIAGFILVGGALGVLPTLALILIGVIAGALLLRRQGVATLDRVRAEVAARRLPGRTVAEGMVKAFAALLLIIPGFLTDLIAVLLLIPPIREALWRLAAARAKAFVPGGFSGASRPTLIELEPGDFRAASRGRPVLPDDKQA